MCILNGDGKLCRELNSSGKTKLWVRDDFVSTVHKNLTHTLLNSYLICPRVANLYLWCTTSTYVPSGYTGLINHDLLNRKDTFLYQNTSLTGTFNSIRPLCVYICNTQERQWGLFHEKFSFMGYSSASCMVTWETGKMATCNIQKLVL